MRTAPCAKLRLDFPRMDFAALADELEHRLRAPLLRGGPSRPHHARVHQQVMGSRQEAVVDEHILFDGQRRIQALQVAGTIVDDAMPQCEVLCARRRPNRVGLHEPEPVDRSAEVDGRKETSRYGMAAQVVAGDGGWHRGQCADRRADMMTEPASGGLAVGKRVQAFPRFSGFAPRRTRQ